MMKRRKISSGILLIIIFCSCMPLLLNMTSGTSIHVLAWTPPPADNTYFSENLDMKLLKDGSLESNWQLVDNGRNQIRFPFPLPTPLNDSTLALLDLRVRIAIVKHDPLPREWGAYTVPVQYNEFTNLGDQGVTSQVFLEYYARVDTASNVILVRTKLDLLTAILQNNLTGVKFDEYFENIADIGGGQRRLTMRLSAFPSDDVIKNAMGFLLDHCLPTGAGLFRLDKSAVVNAKHALVHIAGNWDNQYVDQYAQEPYINGVTEHNDLRWEYIAGISTYQDRKVSINQGSANTLLFKDVVPFGNSLSSNPAANVSTFSIQLFHGCAITGASPNDITAARLRGTYYFDMLGTGIQNYELPASANVNFTAGQAVVPVLAVNATTDITQATLGQIVTITYTVTNIGAATAYNVALEDGYMYLNPGMTPGLPSGVTIVQGDDDHDNISESSWSQITTGESKTFQAKLNCTPASPVAVYTNPLIIYHAAQDYNDANSWARNPNDWYGGYRIYGVRTGINCNLNGLLLSMHASLSSTSATIGDTINVLVRIRNNGTADAVNVTWTAPRFGLNTTVSSGFIALLQPGQALSYTVGYKVDHPERFLGDFIEPRFNPQYAEGSLIYGAFVTISSNELGANIFPANDRAFGPIVFAWRDTSESTVDGNWYVQVTIHVKNFGDSPAYNVDANVYLPIVNFTVVSGSVNPTAWGVLFPGMQYDFSCLVLLPAGRSASDDFVFLLITYQQAVYSWFDASTRASEITHDFGVPAAGIDPLIAWILGIALAGTAIFAVVVLLMLLQEKGKIHISRPSFKRGFHK